MADTLEKASPRLSTFVSSRPGDIGADAAWLPAIESALIAGDRYLILLTPNSINRPWVAFETGAAWFSNRTLVLARTSILAPEEIPAPMSARQAYRLDQPDEASVIFHTLGTVLPDPEGFAMQVGALAMRVSPEGVSEPAWEGMLFNGNYFAWAGPLLALEDRDPIEMPPGLLEELQSRGLRVRLGRRDRLTKHQGRGLFQVFATDRRNWRREVRSQDTLLLVGGPKGDL